MTSQLQYYLIYSPKIPADLHVLVEDETTFGEKDFHGKIEEDFGQTLLPLGTDLTTAKVKVPEGTLFAGILWGDGEHFDEYRDNTMGILGEIDRTGSEDCEVYGPDGSVVASFDNIRTVGLPPVVPPEAYGLKRKPWWKKAYLWCND